MNGDTLATEIKAAYDILKPAGTSIDLDFVKALANAIVDHITANAKATGTDAPSGDTHNLAIG